MRTLSNDGLLAVAERLGVQTLPLVLAAGPRQDSYDEWRAARERAVAELNDAEVFDAEGEVDTDLAEGLYVLTQPDHELVARGYGPEHTLRGCVASRAQRYAVAIRTGDSFDIGTVWCDGSPAALVRPLLDALGPGEPAVVGGFSAPADELADRLNSAETTGDYVDALYALGVPDRDATLLGSALGGCQAYTEIVAYSHADGRTTRAPGAVVVYDTGRGRIAAAPMVSPDRQVWSTVTTGSDHRVAQAVATLLEGLPGGRWPTP